MQHEETRYLAALQDYSRPMRDFWSIRWINPDTLDFFFKGDDSLYRYWNATACVEFTLAMAKRALDIELREETEFLRCQNTTITDSTDLIWTTRSPLSAM